MSKAQIATAGTRLGVDFSRTWSCYKGGEDACGFQRQAIQTHAGGVEDGVGDDGAHGHDGGLAAALRCELVVLRRP